MDSNPSAYAVGDVHGHMDKLVRLLRAQDLVDEGLTWRGRDASLWFMGDFTDRGPEGLAVIDLIMRLQSEAVDSGGHVGALLGNHDVTLLAASRFGAERSTGPGGTFRADWQRNGGNSEDLERLTEEHVAWLMDLPAMAHAHRRLLVHADATFYEGYGSSVSEVNGAINALLASADTAAWDRLLHQFSDREAFVDPTGKGASRARKFLEKYGGKQIIHAHTPIDKISGRPPETVTGALVYADGLCVDVDGGMYRGGEGFLYALVPAGAVIL